MNTFFIIAHFQGLCLLRIKKNLNAFHHEKLMRNVSMLTAYSESIFVYLITLNTSNQARWSPLGKLDRYKKVQFSVEMSQFIYTEKVDQINKLDDGIPMYDK